LSRWPITPLKGHIAESSIRKGNAPAEVLSVTNTDGFVRSLDVFDKQVFSQDASNYKLVRLNDLAYNPSRINVGSVARCHFREGGAVSPMYVVVRCSDSLLPQFLLYFLKSGIGQQHIAYRCVGAVRFMLRFGDLEQIELPLPPVAEQERIVRILDEAEALRRLRGKADERTNMVVSALFDDMFGDPANNRRKWPALLLGSLCAQPPSYGTMIPASPDEGGWLCLRVGNIQNGVLNLDDKKYVDLPTDCVARHSVRDGDLLLARAIGSRDQLGKCIIARPGGQRWAFDSHLMRVRLSLDKAKPDWLQALLAPNGTLGEKCNDR